MPQHVRQPAGISPTYPYVVRPHPCILTHCPIWQDEQEQTGRTRKLIAVVINLQSANLFLVRRQYPVPNAPVRGVSSG